MNKKPETYKCMALSTSHLKLYEVASFDRLIRGKDSQVMAREYGYFIKLTGCVNQFEEAGMSGDFDKIIKYAIDNGYQLIEFDCDADTCELFETFEW